MKQITWKEFRDYVDKYLKENNIPEDVEIACFDFSWQYTDAFERDRLSIYIEDDGMAIF